MKLRLVPFVSLLALGLAGCAGASPPDREAEAARRRREAVREKARKEWKANHERDWKGADAAFRQAMEASAPKPSAAQKEGK